MTSKKHSFLFIHAILFLIIGMGCVTENDDPELILCDGKLQIYNSNNSNGKTILMLPGGGYSFHDDYTLKECIPIFLKHGYTIAILYYDLPNGDPEKPIKSVLNAIAELRENSHRLNIVQNSIGVMGISAGAHLAATTISQMTPSERPSFQILLSPLLSMEDDITHLSSAKNFLGENIDENIKKAYTPIFTVDKSICPTFIAVSLADWMVNPQNALRYKDALLKAGVEVQEFISQKGEHAQEYDWEVWDTLTENIINWLQSR